MALSFDSFDGVARFRADHDTRRVRLAWQVPLGLALATIAVVALGARFELVGALYLAAATPELCRVDVAEHRLPNRLVLPGLAFAAVGLAFGSLAAGASPGPAVVVAVVVGGFFLLLATSGGVGMGDVKLALLLALAGSSVAMLLVVGTVVLAFLAAGLAALVQLAARGGGRPIAFGPYLLGGFWASVVGAAALV